MGTSIGIFSNEQNCETMKSSIKLLMRGMDYFTSKFSPMIGSTLMRA